MYATTRSLLIGFAAFALFIVAICLVDGIGRTVGIGLSHLLQAALR